MGTTATDSGGGGDFTPAPEGTHIARCVRVIDLGTQPGSQQYPTPKQKVLIAWELPNETSEWEGKEEPRLTMSRYTLSLHENAALRRDLQSWRGRAFTETELAGFDLKTVLGVPCMITLVHASDGRYANIQAVAGLPKGMEAPPQVLPSVHYEIEEGASEAFNGFSEKMQDTIRSATEWPGGNDGPPVSESDDPGFGDGDMDPNFIPF